MRPIQVTISSLSNDANGICEDQTTAGAGNLVLDGALVVDGVAVAEEAQIVSIEGSGNNSAVNFTVTGQDANGISFSESLPGPNNSTVTTAEHFKTVSQIAVDAAVTGNVEAGWLASDGAVTKAYVTNWRQSPYNQSLFVDIDGTMTVSAQHTESAPEDSYSNSFSSDAIWRETSGLSGVTSSDESNITFPVRAVRAQITAYTSGTLTFTAIQGQNG